MAKQLCLSHGHGLGDLYTATAGFTRNLALYHLCRMHTHSVYQPKYIAATGMILCFSHQAKQFTLLVLYVTHFVAYSTLCLKRNGEVLTLPDFEVNELYME